MTPHTKDISPEMAADKKVEKPKATPLACGVIMPISPSDGCGAEHWSEVKSIISESVEGISDPKFTVRLVSDADDVGVIQKRIVQNIYSSDIVICDVSGKNPNVMFELGMRLAFDKATVIMKDDKTDYSFDTGIIEHVPYPRDLRFSRIVTFKAALAEKVLATQRAAKADPGHSTFLKNFGKFQVANLQESIVPAEKLTFELLRELQDDVHRIRRELAGGRMMRPDFKGNVSFSKAIECGAKMSAAIANYLRRHPSTRMADLMTNDDFVSTLESECEAPQYFPGPIEFRSALDEVLGTMLAAKASSTSRGRAESE